MPDIKGAEIVELPMLHPAGNTGVQIANIAPVNKGETVWTLDIVTLARIGRLMSDGRVDYSVKVAVTGSEVQNPRVVSTLPGAPLESLLKGNVKADGRNHRIISGNVLTGTPKARTAICVTLPSGDGNPRGRRCRRVYGLGFSEPLQDEREPLVSRTFPWPTLQSRCTPPGRTPSHDHVGHL